MGRAQAQPILDKVFAGDDVSAARDVHELFDIVNLAKLVIFNDKPLNTWCYRGYPICTSGPTGHSFGLSAVLLPGMFPTQLDDHAYAGGQLLNLLTDRGCALTLAALLRHEQKGYLRTAYLERKLSEAIAAAAAGSFKVLEELLVAVDSDQRVAVQTLLSLCPDGFRSFLRAVVPETLAETNIMVPEFDWSLKLVSVRAFRLNLPRETAPRWFLLAHMFGLSSRDVSHVGTDAHSNSMSTLALTHVVLREPASKISKPASNEQQAAIWLDLGLRAQQGANLGERWDAALSGPVVERLTRSLTSEDEHQEAVSFLRALMARRQSAPSITKVALLRDGALRDALPDDVRVWVEA